MFICASPLGEAQLNRMLDRCRPLGPASPTGRVNTWPSSTLTPASTADLRPRPTCSATLRVSPPSVHQMVLTLEREGWIRKKPGLARSIEVLVDPERLPLLCKPQPVKSSGQRN